MASVFRRTLCAAGAARTLICACAAFGILHCLAAEAGEKDTGVCVKAIPQGVNAEREEKPLPFKIEYIPSGIRFTIPNVFESLAQTMPKVADFLEDLDTLSPEGAAALRSLKNFTCTAKFSGADGVAVSLTAFTANEYDADTLASMLRSGLESEAGEGIEKPAVFVKRAGMFEVKLRMTAEKARSILAVLK